MDILKYVEALLSVVASSIVLVVAGIVYFIVTLFTIKVSASIILGEGALEPNYAVLAGSLLVAASMISSALGQRHPA
jgi:hypothetical protein